MPTTVYKGYSVPTPGTESGTWGSDLNANTFAIIDKNLGGVITIPVSNANVTLSATDAQNGIIRITGVLTAMIAVIIPTNGIYVVQNATTGSFLLRIGGTVGEWIILPQNLTTVISIDNTYGAIIAGQRASTVGMIAAFPGTNAPHGWAMCNGQLLDRGVYARLWAFAQNTGNLKTEAEWWAGPFYGAFSSGDGSTSFRVPEIRGLFPRAWAGGQTVYDSGRVANTIQQSIVLNHTHPISITDNHFHYSFNGDIITYPGGALTNANYPIIESNIPSYLANYRIRGSDTVPALGKTSLSQNPPTASSSDNPGGSAVDNRPPNVAFMYCISCL